jgi:hypothetical protein
MEEMAVWWGNKVVAHIVDRRGRNILEQEHGLRVENMLLEALQESGGLAFVLDPRHVWGHSLAAFLPHDSHKTHTYCTLS